MNPYPADTALELPTDAVADRLRQAIRRLLGDTSYDAGTPLVELGADSLTLLRLIAIVTDDPDREIEPMELDAVDTVHDLYEYLAAWHRLD
ncbi:MULTISPECIES: acyl carrier protein [unclassified Micromonospora]|uniref:acyl carrier protein n=1 Tax=unclassified Micromonospora TaxID=2617518 RepID=UPI00363E22A0